jgi:hypothetical protein
MEPAIPSERRAHARQQVQLEALERSDGGLYFQRTRNLSMGGAFLEGTLPHPPGTRVMLELQLPSDTRPLILEGEVVAAPDGGVGMGVRFISPTGVQRLRLTEILQGTPSMRVTRR